MAPEAANSKIGLLVFDRLRDYKPEALEKKLRYQIRKAEGRFVIRPVVSAKELTEAGYPVYCSFLDRTNYQFRQERREKSHFATWAQDLYAFPQVRVLGAYEGETLRAVSVSFLVEDVLFYATFFSDSESLKHCVSDAMVHHIRSAVVRQNDVRLIFAGMRGMDRGLDAYYLNRGAQILEIPARITGNPLARFALRLLAPSAYRRMLGDFSVEEEGNESGNTGTH